MAYSNEEKEFKELIPYPKNESYRSKNARKVNSNKKPNGFLYIIEIEEHNLYKVGVSADIKRRIKDIRSHVPFYCKVIYLGWFYDVYELEEQIHKHLSINKFKGEWFQCYNEDILELINSLSYEYLKENNLLKAS